MKNVGRWFGGRRDEGIFDPLKPEVPPVVEGPLSYLEKNGIPSIFPALWIRFLHRLSLDNLIPMTSNNV